VLQQVAQRERQANLRAGLIAATIVNSNPYRKKGARRLKPEDFIKGPREYMTAEEGARFMDRWAKHINKGHELSAKSEVDTTLQPRRNQ
jgi:hypothetical protein